MGHAGEADYHLSGSRDAEVALSRPLVEPFWLARSCAGGEEGGGRSRSKVHRDLSWTDGQRPTSRGAAG